MANVGSKRIIVINYRFSVLKMTTEITQTDFKKSQEEFQLSRQTPSGRKVCGRKKKKKEKERRIMPSLVATTSALARKPCVSIHYVRTNNAKFNGHYICPRTQNVRAHALRSHQFNNNLLYSITHSCCWLISPLYFSTVSWDICKKLKHQSQN